MSRLFDIVRRIGPDGMPVRGLRRINPEQAEVVVRIFEAYAAERSARRIAHDLNARGIPAPGGRSWGASTISGNVARGTGFSTTSSTSAWWSGTGSVG